MRGPSGPRIDASGLAVFTISVSQPRIPPGMLAATNPLVVVEGAKVVTVGIRAVDLWRSVIILYGTALQEFTYRPPKRSCLSTKGVSRVTVDILLVPTRQADLDIRLQLPHLRRTTFQLMPCTVCSLCSVPRTPCLFLELGGPIDVHPVWPAIAFTDDRCILDQISGACGGACRVVAIPTRLA